MNTSTGEVRFGVIGCGIIAYWSHLRELRSLPAARLIAVADPDGEARERATQLTGAASHEDAAELLRRQDVDAVVISAPTHLHASLAIAAAEAGKHIYIEKPLATTAEDARQVEQAVQSAGVCAAMGFNRRHHPLYAEARRLIAQGTIGRVGAVMSTFSEPVGAGAMPMWKRLRSTGGGVLSDLASHHVDLARWFLNDEVLEVEARTQSVATEQDQATLRLQMRSGVEWQSFLSFRTGRADWIEFIGESGTLRVDRHRPWLSVRVSRRFGYGVRNALLLPPTDVVRWWAIRARRPSYEPSYRLALSAFVRFIQGEETGVVTIEDGRRSLDVVLAAEESARTGRSISLGTSW